MYVDICTVFQSQLNLHNRPPLSVSPWGVSALYTETRRAASPSAQEMSEGVGGISPACGPSVRLSRDVWTSRDRWGHGAGQELRWRVGWDFTDPGTGNQWVTGVTAACVTAFWSDGARAVQFSEGSLSSGSSQGERHSQNAGQVNTSR